MATLPNPLPRLSALGLDLPPGRLIDETDEGPWHEPLLWVTDEQPAPGTWDALQHTAPAVGLLPVLVEVGGDLGGPEDWELVPGEMSYPGDHDAEEVLTEFWYECAADGEDWPGLADTPHAGNECDPDAAASALVGSVLEGGVGPFKAASPSSPPAAAPTFPRR
jgi:hypothetical protein